MTLATVMLMLLLCSGLHRHVWLVAKPAAACITDYSVTTPLTFTQDVAGDLSKAELQVSVSIEVQHECLISEGQLSLSLDLLLPDGTPLLQNHQMPVQQVRHQGSLCRFVCHLKCNRMEWHAAVVLL